MDLTNLPPGAIRKLITKLEEDAEILKKAVAIVERQQAASASQRSATTLRQALDLDAERRNGHAAIDPVEIDHEAVPAPTRKQPKSYTLKEKARREQTMKFLATMSRTVPKPYPGSVPHVLVNTGYLARKGDGFIRTAKPFTLTKPSTMPRTSTARQSAPGQAAKPVGWNSRAAKEARHQEMAAIWVKFTRVRPRSGKGFGRGPIGNLVRQGFLQKKGDGYIRTAKQFTAHWVSPYEKRTKQAARPAAKPSTTWKPAKRNGLKGNAVVRAQRERSVAFLNLFGTDVPTMPPLAQYPPGFQKGGLGPLVRRGYLAKSGDGYIRTAKPFEVDGLFKSKAAHP